MSVEIYIDDLKPDIERQVLEELGLETAEDGNYDIIPLFSVERPPPPAPPGCSARQQQRRR